ncbi:MAG: hypothetical protein IJA63_04800 [Akkermansia sp.]|nr:hypothetical protein [Akkermansia sp.]
MAISTSPEDAEDYQQKLTEWSHRMPSNDSLSNEILQFVCRHPEQINTVHTIGGQSVTALSIAFMADDHELMIALLKLGALPYPPPGDSVWKQAPWYTEGSALLTPEKKQSLQILDEAQRRYPTFTALVEYHGRKIGNAAPISHCYKDSENAFACPLLRDFDNLLMCHNLHLATHPRTGERREVLREKIAERILFNPEEINVTEYKGKAFTPLMLALELRDTALAMLLLSYGALPYPPDYRSFREFSPEEKVLRKVAELQRKFCPFSALLHYQRNKPVTE